jgi:hypothetical protein
LAAACALTARPPSLQSRLGKGGCCATLIEVLGMLGVVDVVVFGWSPRPLTTALRGSLYAHFPCIFVILSWQPRMSRS